MVVVPSCWEFSVSKYLGRQTYLRRHRAISLWYGGRIKNRIHEREGDVQSSPSWCLHPAQQGRDKVSNNNKNLGRPYYRHRTLLGEVSYLSVRAWWEGKHLQPSPAKTTAHDSAANMNRDKKTLMRIVQICVSLKRLCLKGTCLVRMKDCHFKTFKYPVISSSHGTTRSIIAWVSQKMTEMVWRNSQKPLLRVDPFNGALLTEI